jgi:6-phosphogluconolactonase (cycloisomerase 2 family)
MSQPGPAGDRQSAPHPHQVILDPTGKFILSPDLGADLVRVFSVDSSTGQLTPCSNLTAAPGSGPRHVGFYVPSGDASQGTYMYLASEIANTVTAYKVTYPGSKKRDGAGEGGLSFTKIQGPDYAYPNNTPPEGVTSYVSEVRVLVCSPCP